MDIYLESGEKSSTRHGKNVVRSVADSAALWRHAKTTFPNETRSKKEKEQKKEKKNLEQMKQEIFDQILAVVNEDGGTAKWGADLEELLQADSGTFVKKAQEMSNKVESEIYTFSVKDAVLTLFTGIPLMGIAYILHPFVSEAAGNFLYLLATLVFLLLVLACFCLLYKEKAPLRNFFQERSKKGESETSTFSVKDAILLTLFTGILLMGTAYFLHPFVSETAGYMPYLSATLVFLLPVIACFDLLCKEKAPLRYSVLVFSILLMKVFEYILHIPRFGLFFFMLIYLFGFLLIGIYSPPTKGIIDFGKRISVNIVVFLLVSVLYGISPFS